jgi:hypothetical protein
MGPQEIKSMGAKITAVRCQLKKDELVITAVGQSPRGTKVLLKRAVAKGRKGPREEFQKNVEDAIKAVTSKDE